MGPARSQDADRAEAQAQPGMAQRLATSLVRRPAGVVLGDGPQLVGEASGVTVDGGEGGGVAAHESTVDLQTVQDKQRLSTNHSVWAYGLGMLDVNRLRVFRAVVASGSVQAAARHLGYTPSTISQHITALQRETGLVLFEKAGRGIVPTATGRLLAAESEEVMSHLAKLTGMVDDLRSGHTGGLEIASFSSAAQEWLPSVVRRLREDFPALVIDLALNEVADAPGADIDIRVEDPDGEPRDPTGWCRRVLAEESYVCVVPADHALADRGQIGLVDLEGEAWIRDDRAESMCTRIIGRAATAAGVGPNYVARSDDHHTALAFVAAGVGVCVLPRLATLHAPAGTVALDLHDPAPRRRIVALMRDSSEANPAAQRAITLLLEAARGVDEQRAA